MKNRDVFMTPQRDRTLVSNVDRNSVGSPAVESCAGSAKKFKFRKTSSPNVNKIPADIDKKTVNRFNNGNPPSISVSGQGGVVSSVLTSGSSGTDSSRTENTGCNVKAPPQMASPTEPMWDDGKIQSFIGGSLGYCLWHTIG